MTSKI
jgi:phage-related protein